MGLYYVLILIPLLDQAMYAYLKASAWAVSHLLNLFGQGSHVDGTSIESATCSIVVRRGCDALEPAWFHCAAVLAFPAPFRRKLPGMLIGVTVIMIFNLVRIGSLFLFRRYYPSLFSAAHLEVWPILFLFLALALWVGWISWTRKNEAQEHAIA